MELNLIDKITLLAIDDEKGTLIADSLIFNYAIASSVILELILKNKIDIYDKKIRVIDDRIAGNKILEKQLNIIKNSKKKKSIKGWIELIGEKAGHIKAETIDNLVEANILSKKEGKFLWVFDRNKYPAQNSNFEDKLRIRLKDIIVRGKKPELNEILLLSLIDSCNLNKEVFGKEDTKELKRKIKLIIEDNELSKLINKSIKDVYDTLIAVIIIIT